MLETTPFSIVIGAVLGFLTGLGTGGGSLLVLWLTLVLHMDPAQARLINLMFFLPAAVISTILHWKQGRIPLKKVLLPTIAGCITAAVLSFVGQKIDTENLKKLFGVLLIFTGLRELFYRPRKPK
jgi:uncharacterized membrane protein YfcA